MSGIDELKKMVVFEAMRGDGEWRGAAARALSEVDGLLQRAEQAERHVRRLEEQNSAQERHNLDVVARVEQAERERGETADLLETALSQRVAAERERDEALVAIERAELERDEWSRRFQESANIVSDAALAKERAEADNAALLLKIKQAGSALYCGGFVDLTTGGEHPGAALLERMRHLEEKVGEFARYAREAHEALSAAGVPTLDGASLPARVGLLLERWRALETVREALKQPCLNITQRTIGEREAAKRLGDTCAAYDALKVTHE